MKGKVELQCYEKEGLAILGDTSSLEWWCQTIQRSRYPLLSKMAIDIISVPAMSAEPERLFFFCQKKTIDDSRNHLQATIVEALECMKSWFKGGYYMTAPEAKEVRELD